MLSSLTNVEFSDLRNIWIVAKVIANDDSGETAGPKLQRIKVTVPGLYETESPWCWPLQLSLFAGGQGAGFGTFGVPEIGSYVVIELQNGDPHYPVYIGTILIQGNQITEAGTNYPNRYGFKDSAGNIFYIDKTNGQKVTKYTHPSGTTIEINNAGNVTINSVGTLNLISTGNMTITAPVVNMTGSGAVQLP